MSEQAVKHNQGKPRVELVPPEAILAMARVFGAAAATKYPAWNYLTGDGLSHTALAAAAMRHLLAYLQGEDVDPEFGEKHIAHALCSLSMLLTSIERGKGKDDRWKPEPSAEFLTTDLLDIGVTSGFEIRMSSDGILYGSQFDGEYGDAASR